MLRRALVALAALALLALGLGIIIYVSLARERIMPTPTPAPPLSVTRPMRPTRASSGTPTRQVVAVGRVREYSEGALVILLEPLEGQVTQVIVTEGVSVLLADGKESSPAAIARGQVLRAEGPLDPLGRLIARRITIIAQSATVTATALPQTDTPTASPLPDVPEGAWRGEYYPNRTLAGPSVLVRVDPSIDFRWQRGGPDPGVPADSFSARWRGRWTFDEGVYRLQATADDGVRVWVDGELVIDQWRDQAAATFQADVALGAGAHELQVEYYEAADDATLRVWWEFRGLYPDWRGEYYSNPQLSGVPELVRNDAGIDFDWGASAPDPRLPPDNFSARWARTFALEEGPYRFRARADDGLRLWVDGLLLIDAWQTSSAIVHEGHLLLSKGPHQIVMEYHEDLGLALVQLDWTRLESFPDWKGEYYANATLAGRPTYIRNDRDIAFEWLDLSPGPGLPGDSFSVRWSRVLAFAKGWYRFWADTDDGVRVHVDGTRVIDAWRDAAGRQEVVVELEKGRHELVVEYYEHSGTAKAHFGWEAEAVPTSTDTPTIAPSTPTQTTAPSTLTPTMAADTVTASPSPTPPPPTTAIPTLTPTATSSAGAPTVSATPTQGTPQAILGPRPAPASAGKQGD